MGRPTVGGALAAQMHAVRDAVLERRRSLRADRQPPPSVADFFATRAVLVTGASGFLGRLLVEKLLRSCPDLGRVYVVLRTKRGADPAARLRTMVDVPLFDRLRAERPAALDKLVVLPGDISELRLGLSDEHVELVRREVSVIVHMAASVRFDDSFRKAVFTNLRSTREVVELARTMPKLKVLQHVSTAFTNIDHDVVEERVYPPAMDWRDVIRWAEGVQDSASIDALGPKVLGFQPNTYTFTKALAEKLIDDVAGELPVIITRPSIVVATFEDPIPGWVDNLYGFCGFWAGGFKGICRIHYGQNIVFDSIPADSATKLIVQATWARGIQDQKCFPGEGADVVNVTIGLPAGISFEDMEWCVSEEGVGRIVPYPGALRPPKFRYTPCPFWFALVYIYEHLLFGFIVDLAARLAGVRPRVIDIYKKIRVALLATHQFTRNFTFKTDNANSLQSIIHPADEEHFCLMRSYSCRDSVEIFRQIVADTVRGILVYALKEEHNPEKNWRAITRLKWVMWVYHSVMALLFCGIVYVLYLTKTSLSANRLS